MHAEAAALLLHFARGERLAETVSSSDRVAWVLPKKKLDAARRHGIVIVEDMVSVTLASLTVLDTDGTTATIRSSATTVTLDVPRHTSSTIRASAAASVRVDGRHNPMKLSPTEAVTADLPTAGVVLGQRWVTTEHVLTTLGSGEMHIVHTVTALSPETATVSVKGFGSITGFEYDLPRLLPGRMFIEGTAIFDRATGTFVRETYTLHNEIIKPDHGEHIGFDEHENVAVTTVVQH